MYMWSVLSPNELFSNTLAIKSVFDSFLSSVDVDTLDHRDKEIVTVLRSRKDDHSMRDRRDSYDSTSALWHSYFNIDGSSIHSFMDLNDNELEDMRTSLLDEWPVKTVAQQLCLVNMGLRQRITAQNLLTGKHANVGKKGDQGRLWCKSIGSGKSQDSLSDEITFFNSLPLWVGESVLSKPNIKGRAQTIEKFIELADRCKELGGFNAGFAILLGLQSTAVKRLSSWYIIADEKRAKFDDMVTLFSPDSSYKLYREVVDAAERPCIPYLGLLLRDLVFLKDSAPIFLGESKKLVNFQKCKRMARLMHRYHFSKVGEYKFNNNATLGDRLFLVFQCSHFLTSDDLLQKSNSLEASVSGSNRDLQRLTAGETSLSNTMVISMPTARMPVSISKPSHATTEESLAQMIFFFAVSVITEFGFDKEMPSDALSPSAPYVKEVKKVGIALPFKQDISLFEIFGIMEGVSEERPVQCPLGLEGRLDKCLTCFKNRKMSKNSVVVSISKTLFFFHILL